MIREELRDCPRRENAAENGRLEILHHLISTNTKALGEYEICPVADGKWYPI